MVAERGCRVLGHLDQRVVTVLKRLLIGVRCVNASLTGEE
jgi:hypothetical protein